MTEQRFEIKTEAILEIRDADGNVVSSTPVESTRIVNEQEMLAIKEGLA